MTSVTSGKEEAATEAREVIEIQGWRGLVDLRGADRPLRARRAGNADEARKFLEEAATKCDNSVWPYPVVRILRGENNEKALLAAATDNDKMTEVRCYIGLDEALKNHLATASEHLLWVKKHGNPRFSEHAMPWLSWSGWSGKNQPGTK